MLRNITAIGSKCPSCGNKKIVTDQSTGELFCEKCGFVFVEKITDAGAEWRSFPNDQTDKTRVGGRNVINNS